MKYLIYLCTYQYLAPPTPDRAIVGIGGAFDTKNAPGVGISHHKKGLNPNAGD